MTAAEQLSQAAQQAAAARRQIAADAIVNAAIRLADPNDALQFVDVDTIQVGDDGAANGAQVRAVIDQLGQSYPALLRHRADDAPNGPVRLHPAGKIRAPRASSVPGAGHGDVHERARARAERMFGKPTT